MRAIVCRFFVLGLAFVAITSTGWFTSADEYDAQASAAFNLKRINIKGFDYYSLNPDTGTESNPLP